MSLAGGRTLEVQLLGRELVFAPIADKQGRGRGRASSESHGAGIESHARGSSVSTWRAQCLTSASCMASALLADVLRMAERCERYSDESIVCPVACWQRLEGRARQ